tara:strand:- start:2633 stop:3079 length:447 start_codon:yes stop_codon:yes gene_type:complete
MSFVKIAREFLTMVKNDLDKHTTQKNVVKVKNFKEVSLFTPGHIQFAKYGRGPGKKPPLDSILRWVNEKGIIFSGSDARGTAFAIQKSIGKNGTKNYVPNAPNALMESLNKYKEGYNSKLNGEIVLEQNREIKKGFEQSFPREIVISR